MNWKKIDTGIGIKLERVRLYLSGPSGRQPLVHMYQSDFILTGGKYTDHWLSSPQPPESVALITEPANPLSMF